MIAPEAEEAWELFNLAAVRTEAKGEPPHYDFQAENVRLAFDLHFDPQRAELFRLLRALKARMNRDVPWDTDE